jgi:hypothetical protein
MVQPEAPDADIIQVDDYLFHFVRENGVQDCQEAAHHVCPKGYAKLEFFTRGQFLTQNSHRNHLAQLPKLCDQYPLRYGPFVAKFSMLNFFIGP